MFYTQGVTKDGNIALIKMTASIWIIDGLETNCLLENIWFTPHCIHIDYDFANLSFPNLDSFYIPFDTQKRANPVVRKVILV